MDLVLIIFEVFVLALIVMFSGILDSKYYQQRNVRYLSTLIIVTMVSLFALLFADAPYCGGRSFALFWWHVVYNVLATGVCIYAVIKYQQVKLKYKVQSLLADWTLNMSVVLQFCAIVTLCMMRMSER